MSERFPSEASGALYDAAVALRDALLAERGALDGGEATSLLSLAAEKRRRVSVLERASAAASSVPPAAARILVECRELNAANAAAVATRLAATRAALVRLARLSGSDDAWGYSADGLPTRPRRARTLGLG